MLFAPLNSTDAPPEERTGDPDKTKKAATRVPPAASAERRWRGRREFIFFSIALTLEWFQLSPRRTAPDVDDERHGKHDGAFHALADRGNDFLHHVIRYLEQQFVVDREKEPRLRVPDAALHEFRLHVEHRLLQDIRLAALDGHVDGHADDLLVPCAHAFEGAEVLINELPRLLARDAGGLAESVRAHAKDDAEVQRLREPPLGGQHVPGRFFKNLGSGEAMDILSVPECLE